MGRLLDEDDVIRAVDEHTNDDNALDDDITCVLENVPTAQSLNWILCREKLPLALKEKLLSINEGSYGSYVAQGYLREDGKWKIYKYKDAITDASIVTAWCDMPEPYKPRTTPQRAVEILKNEMACVLSKECVRTECKNCALVMNENEILDALNMAIEVLQEKEK